MGVKNLKVFQVPNLLNLNPPEAVKLVCVENDNFCGKCRLIEPHESHVPLYTKEETFQIEKEMHKIC